MCWCRVVRVFVLMLMLMSVSMRLGLFVRMGVFMNMAGAIGVDMHMDMRSCLALDSDFTFTTTTGHTHPSSPHLSLLGTALARYACCGLSHKVSYYFQLLDTHFGTTRHLHLVAAAARACAKNLGHGHGFGAGHAPALSGRGNDLQPGTIGHAATRDGIKTKGHGLRLHTRELTDFQPDGGNLFELVFARGVFNQLQHAFGQRHFMHGEDASKPQAHMVCQPLVAGGNMLADTAQH